MDNQTKTRFWEKVSRTSNCWLWIGARTSKGYGNFSINKKSYAAHRLSWELHNGDIPDGQMVLHTCDNPACINPAHLYLGTSKDNMQDQLARERHSKWFSRPKAHTKSVKNRKLYQDLDETVADALNIDNHDQV